MYDLVIYGATGFTGKLAVEYVAKQYGSKLKWAIAGRSKERLEDLKKGGASCDILLADAMDVVALRDMVKQTKVVVACAGPFSRYGSKLVAACVEAGVDYCDITGEVAWVREMIATHDDEARRTGARIVHLCGHDSVPWDLMTLVLTKKLMEMGGGELKRIDFWDDIQSAPSGGTIETAFELRYGAKPKTPEVVKALGYDPLLKPAGTASTASEFGLKAQNIGTIQLSGSGDPRIMFFMAGVNAAVVKRSNALLGYGSKPVYCEGQAFKSKLGAAWAFLGWAAYGCLIAIPPVRAFMRRFCLPKPGEGPSEATMEAGHLIITGVAKSVDGKTAKATLGFPVDPGYKDTARMAIEAGLSLSLDSSKLANKSGGVLTPAACQGEVLLERLIATGCSFSHGGLE